MTGRPTRLTLRGMATAQPSADPTQKPRVVIVDADRRVQQSLGEALRLSGLVEVVGSAGDVRTALEIVALKEPTVILVDPHLPDVAAAPGSSTASRWHGQ